MGMGQCMGCKEYYHPSNNTLYEWNLSQSSYIRNFKNPFFPGEIDINNVSDDNINNNIPKLKENEDKIFDEIIIKENLEQKEEENKLKEELELKQKMLNEEAEKRNEELNKLKNDILHLNNISNIKEDNQSSLNNKKIEISGLSKLNSREVEENVKINKTLENMCILGNIAKKEIQEEKENNPEKFIETSEALKLEQEDNGLFALGLLSQNLEGIGIETAIEKDVGEDEQDASATCLQFISNGEKEIK